MTWLVSTSRYNKPKSQGSYSTSETSKIYQSTLLESKFFSQLLLNDTLEMAYRTVLRKID